jgi:cbb3-type cytochrome oxidase subunit 3
MTETVLAILFMGVAWWLWAGNQKSERDEKQRRREQDRAIAAYERGLTDQQVQEYLELMLRRGLGGRWIIGKWTHEAAAGLWPK